MALNLHPLLLVKTTIHVHDGVRSLLELAGLEEQSAALARRPDKRASVVTLIESLRATLPAGVLGVHDQMRAKGRRSVAEVRHGVCSGCHLALGLGNVAALRGGEMRRCGNCGRFIFVADEDNTCEAVPAKPGRKPRTSRTDPISNPKPSDR